MASRRGFLRALACAPAVLVPTMSEAETLEDGIYEDGEFTPYCFTADDGQTYCRPYYGEVWRAWELEIRHNMQMRRENLELTFENMRLKRRALAGSADAGE